MKKTIIIFLGVIFLFSSLAMPQVQTQKVQQEKKLQRLLPARFINTAVSVQNPFKPEFLLIKPLATDRPVVHPVLDFYQDSQAYENLFSTNGQSMLCAPASLANALVYLKYNRNPRFEKIAAKHENRIHKNGDWVPLLFEVCKTDRDTGTYTEDMESTAKKLVAEGGYNTADVYVKGAWASDWNKLAAVTPDDLRKLCQEPDKAVVLVFGWYWTKLDQGKKVLQRNGGHCAALAGYDALSPNVFYVSNPLTDYSQIYPLRYSRIELRQLAGDLEVPDHMKWFTGDLVGGNFAVLESILAVLPRPAFSAPKVAK